MRGLLADENVEGHLAQLVALVRAAGLLETLPGVAFASFADVGLTAGTPDRDVWAFCQRERWVLLTANRNNDGPDSLNAAMAAGWTPDDLPVLTFANAGRFRAGGDYADFVARETADVLFGLTAGEYRDQPRVHLPRAPFAPS